MRRASLVAAARHEYPDQSVRFHLGAAPLVVQVSDVAVPVIDVAITAVSETQ